MKINKHFVSPNYNGTNCLLVFCKDEEKMYSFMLNRKSLNSKDINDVMIYSVFLRVSREIYNGTIIEGIFSINTDENNVRHKMMVITDVYLFMNMNMSKTPINNKLMELSGYLKNHLIQDSNNSSLIKIHPQ